MNVMIVIIVMLVDVLHDAIVVVVVSVLLVVVTVFVLRVLYEDLRAKAPLEMCFRLRASRRTLDSLGGTDARTP